MLVSDVARPSTPHLSRNIVANFVGTFWTALMGPALVSVYVRFMGIEAYGLVGILTTLQATFAVLDLGLSTATNRELARYSVQEHDGEAARNLIRTTETIYWAIAGGIAVIVFALAPLLSQRWLHAEHLSPTAIQQAFFIMGIILAFQFPFALYSGGLIGLQRQVLLNTITVGTATLRGLGSVLLLWLVSPTIQAFFTWQLVVTAIQTGTTAYFLWRSLPESDAKPRFRRTMIRSIWRFAAGMMGISFFSLLLMQGDKVVLSRILTLGEFGYYTFAAVVASSLYLIVVPIFTAVFPRFSQLVAADNETALRTLYHQSCQIVSVLLLPAALVIAFFAPEILQIWTHDPEIVRHTHLLVTLLVIGTALNGLMNVPYALQLATGWTKLALYQNAIAVAILMPLLLWMANRYGAVGAATIWIAVNAGYVLIGIQIMHTRLLRGERKRWYLQDVGLPLLGAFTAAVVGRWIFPTNAPLPVMMMALGVVALSALAAAGILAPVTRTWLRQRLPIHGAIRDPTC
jgi:O-antigen/teichoic acid export membrane protein